VGLDLSAPFGPSTIEQSHAAWPKCGQCSPRLARLPKYLRPAVMMGGIWYPVESLALVGRERATELHEKYSLVIEAECHGERETCAIKIPDWYGEGKVNELLSHVIFFRRRGGIEMRTTRGMQ
jgi:hypothetical protein